MFYVCGHIFLLLLLGRGETSQRFFAGSQFHFLHQIRSLTQFSPLFPELYPKVVSNLPLFPSFQSLIMFAMFFGSIPAQAHLSPLLLPCSFIPDFPWQPRDRTMYSAPPPVPHCQFFFRNNGRIKRITANTTFSLSSSLSSFVLFEKLKNPWPVQ